MSRQSFDSFWTSLCAQKAFLPSSDPAFRDIHRLHPMFPDFQSQDRDAKFGLLSKPSSCLSMPVPRLRPKTGRTALRRIYE